MKQLVLVCYLGILLACQPSTAMAAEARSIAAPSASVRPNIIVFLIDDMGWADLSCFGGKVVETKNIDRLANGGIRFQNFYVNSPICSPSRTALTTGHYPARHRITSFLAERKMNDSRGIAQWLDVQAPTLPRMLSEAGYATGHFGKWHLGGQRDVGEAPLITEYGFDASLTNFEGLGPRVLPLKYAVGNPTGQPHALGSDKLGRGPIEWADRSTITQQYVNRALAFINDPVNRDKPLYINLWPDDVHSPFFPPPDKRGDGSKRALYYNVLAKMDEQIGALLERVSGDPKLRDNTLIMLASDNGPEPGAGSAGPLRGAKGELWEGGIRSPLIIWAPGLMAKAAVGSTNDTAILSSVDLTRSLLAISATTLPQEYAPDGENVIDALLGKSKTARTKPLFWRRPPDRPSTPKNWRPDLAVRDGNWKLVCNLDGEHAELYDLSSDVGEAHNSADQHEEIAKRLTQAVLAWNATLPTDATSSAAQ